MESIRSRRNIANTYRRTLSEIQRDPSESLYVLNTSDLGGARPKGEVLITVKSGERETIIRVPSTWIPRDLSVYGEKKVLLANPDIRRCIDNKTLTAIATDVAEEILEEYDAKEEADLIALKSQVADPVTSLQERRERERNLHSDVGDAIIKEREKFLAKGQKNPGEGVTPAVLAIMKQGNLTERQRLAAFRNVEDIMGEKDFHYIMSSASSEDGRILKWARDNIESEAQPLPVVRRKVVKSGIKKRFKK